jgi:Protein of unknown function (DUF1475)
VLTRSLLLTLFTLILLGMLCVTGWASVVQPLWQWQGLVRAPDHAWTIATLVDAYCGFITFYVWVFYKECSVSRRAIWLVAIMLLGNIAMASYVLLALRRLPPQAGLQRLVAERHL